MQEMLFFSAIVLVAALIWSAFKLPANPRFRSKPMLAGPYLEFFQTLRSAFPEYQVFPQVALSALVDPVGGPRGRRFAFECIQGKRAGYAVFDQDMQLITVIELSHRARITSKEAALEACLATAGIKTLRFYSAQMPTEASIRNAIHPYLPQPASHSAVRKVARFTVERKSNRQAMWPNTVDARM